MSVTPSAPKWSLGDAVRWVAYDFAHTAFAMVVLALIFPQMFHTVWGTRLSPEAESIAYKLTQAIPCLLVFVLAPFMGQLAASAGFRARGLRLAVLIGALLTAALALLGEHDWLAASLLYTGAAACFYIGATLYDSMLVDCAPPDRRHILSGIGFSTGFISGILILLALASGWFEGRMVWIYPAAALWWILFALPLLLRPAGPTPKLPPLSVTWAETLATGREIIAQPSLRWFLFAFILYIDGVHAVKTTATHLGSVLGFGPGDLIKAFLVAQIVGVPAALIFGWLGHRFGAPRILAVGILIYTGIAIWGACLSPGTVTWWGFAIPSVWILAALVGLVQGGVQGLSRSHFATLIPEGRAPAYFGFYGMVGRFASFLGPLLGAAAGWVMARPDDPTSAERWGFGSFALLFILGLWGLWRSVRANSEASSPLHS
jgi:UMF1 family MFS transporter